MQELILDVRDIVMQFGGLLAVNHVSIDCKRGEIVGLIGANGAGKTTLFNVISGQFKPKSGVVLFQGKAIQGLPPHKACRLGIGRTHQIVQPLASLTVLENTMVGAFKTTRSTDIARRKAQAVLEKVGLSSRSENKGEELNLPELKRLELARALATEPTLLLLDEVMAGLNPTDCQGVVELIRNIRNKDGVSIILIEHVMRAVMALSERIFVLNQGSLIAQGAPAEVVNHPAVIASYLGGADSAED